ncbi:hypothetical protein KDW36_19600 [Burkholderia dolosa]|uniref:hypothetical protein n=1 Tax=Burkholderia dolosa TaxID=152500 RepID=UPI001BA06C16|nr:hypothetical protein [Burkholderia dolosa]MBR8315392.1 hypothetical protein [Burkholderia dolosa]
MLDDIGIRQTVPFSRCRTATAESQTSARKKPQPVVTRPTFEMRGARRPFPAGGRRADRRRLAQRVLSASARRTTT